MTEETFFCFSLLHESTVGTILELVNIEEKTNMDLEIKKDKLLKERKLCANCSGQGWIYFRGLKTECPSCFGDGLVR